MEESQLLFLLSFKAALLTLRIAQKCSKNSAALNQEPKH